MTDIEFTSAGQYVVWVIEDGQTFPVAHNTREDAQATVDYITAELAKARRVTTRPRKGY